MLVVRFIGALFLLLAVIALTADLSGPAPGQGRTAAASGASSFNSLHQHWNTLAPVSLSASRKFVQGRAHPLLWNSVLRPILDLPAFVSLGLVSLLLLHFGRPRRRVQIYQN